MLAITSGGDKGMPQGASALSLQQFHEDRWIHKEGWIKGWNGCMEQNHWGLLELDLGPMICYCITMNQNKHEEGRVKCTVHEGHFTQADKCTAVIAIRSEGAKWFAAKGDNNCDVPHEAVICSGQWSGDWRGRHSSEWLQKVCIRRSQAPAEGARWGSSARNEHPLSARVDQPLCPSRWSSSRPE